MLLSQANEKSGLPTVKGPSTRTNRSEQTQSGRHYHKPTKKVDCLLLKAQVLGQIGLSKLKVDAAITSQQKKWTAYC